jgi:hypothetical protein
MSTDHTSLTVPEAASILRIDYGRLDKLIRDGFLGELPGGRWRRVGVQHTLAVAVLLRLRRVGVGNRTLRRIVPMLAAMPEVASAGEGSILLVAGERFTVCDAGRLAAEVAASGAQPVVVLGLGPLVDEVRSAISGDDAGRERP